jgi:hypothetical protein
MGASTIEKGKVHVPSFAILGQMSSGKGTYAEALKASLEREFDVQVYRVPSFSVKIADIARDLFGAKDEADGKPDRTLLQKIGKKMREIDSAVWARYLIRKIESEGSLPFVAEGFRDPNELRAFRESFRDMVVVKIDAEEKQRMAAYKRTYGHLPLKRQTKHPTELAIAKMPADIVLHNEFDRETMARQIGEIVHAIKKGTLHDLIRTK